MNIFAEIEGRRGENLASALLRLILVRSQDARGKFAELLTNITGQDFIIRDRFSCELEHGTLDPEQGNGRVDLLIETNDALIGIENKFDALFQPGQPQKYLHSMMRRALALRDGGIMSTARHLLVILAPEARASSIGKDVGGLDLDDAKRCRVLSWERLLDSFAGIAAAQDLKTQLLLAEFEGFVRRYLAIPVFGHDPAWIASLSHWVDSGSERQRQAVEQLWPAFADAGVSGRPTLGEFYYGFYFAKPRGGWFGFVQRRAIRESFDPGREIQDAEFVIVTGYECPPPNQAIFHQVSMINANWSGAPQRNAWVVDIGALRSEEHWQELLRPVLDPVVLGA